MHIIEALCETIRDGLWFFWSDILGSIWKRNRGDHIRPRERR